MLEASSPQADAESCIPVLRLGDVSTPRVAGLISRYGLELELITASSPIPGSYWGDEEAGLLGNQLLAREDTPLHSIFHETCHYVCMDSRRRQGLDTDAGGDYEEENGVCFLQILLADHMDGFGRERMCKDMDGWGYSFRLGSAKAWFTRDAEDARAFLQTHNLIDTDGQPTWRLRNP